MWLCSLRVCVWTWYKDQIVKPIKDYDWKDWRLNAILRLVGTSSDRVEPVSLQVADRRDAGGAARATSRTAGRGSLLWRIAAVGATAQTDAL